MASKWQNVGKAAVRNIRKPKPSAGIPTKWPIVKGDLVEIISGPGVGQQGRVLNMLRSSNKLVVEGVRQKRRVVQPQGVEGTDDWNPGGVYMHETPVNCSDVSLVDPKDGKPVKIKFEPGEDGGSVRISRRSGLEIPKPEYKRVGLEDRSKYEAKPWDTEPSAAMRKTYVPSAMTFEEEVLAACAAPSSS